MSRWINLRESGLGYFLPYWLKIPPNLIARMFFLVYDLVNVPEQPYQVFTPWCELVYCFLSLDPGRRMSRWWERVKGKGKESECLGVLQVNFYFKNLPSGLCLRACQLPAFPVPSAVLQAEPSFHYWDVTSVLNYVNCTQRVKWLTPFSASVCKL